MHWWAATLIIVAAMASVLGLADTVGVGSAIDFLFYVFVAVFAYAFFFLLRAPRRGRGFHRRAHRHE